MKHPRPQTPQQLPLMQLVIAFVLPVSVQIVMTGPELLFLNPWLGVLKSMHRGWLWVLKILGGTIVPPHRLLFDASYLHVLTVK
jgi:hypothetical protein